MTPQNNKNKAKSRNIQSQTTQKGKDKVSIPDQIVESQQFFNKYHNLKEANIKHATRGIFNNEIENLKEEINKLNNEMIYKSMQSEVYFIPRN